VASGGAQAGVAGAFDLGRLLSIFDVLWQERGAGVARPSATSYGCGGGGDSGGSFGGGGGAVAASGSDGAAVLGQVATLVRMGLLHRLAPPPPAGAAVAVDAALVGGAESGRGAKRPRDGKGSSGGGGGGRGAAGAVALSGGKFRCGVPREVAEVLAQGEGIPLARYLRPR